MTQDNIYSSVLYWQLKEFEESSWSGTLVFTENNNQPLGRIIFSNGLITWAEAIKQKHNIFDAMNKWGEISKEDILFAENIYKSSKSKSFSQVMEETGLLSFWTLRESLRVQIYFALQQLTKYENITYQKYKNATPSANQFFKLDELIFAANFEKSDEILDLKNIKEISFIEIKIHKKQTIYKTPLKKQTPKCLQNLAQTCINTEYDVLTSTEENFLPNYVILSYSLGYCTIIRFFDYYDMMIYILTEPNIDVFSLISNIKKFATLTMLPLSEYISDYTNLYGGN